MPRPGILKDEIIRVYWELKKKLGRNPHVSEVMEMVKGDKHVGPNAKNNKRSYINKVLTDTSLVTGDDIDAPS